MKRVAPSVQTKAAIDELLSGGAEGAEDARSTLLRLAGRAEGLENLAVELFARGCSTRDIEGIVQAEDGTALLSKSAAAELPERLWEEYQAFATRDLTEIKPLYLFIDGVAERLTPGSKREAVLCA